MSDMVGTWVSRSLRYYKARHLVFAGTVALTSAILCAALLTGESLRQGLRRDLNARLGSVRSAVYLPEGLFPAGLTQRLPETQAALLLKGELLTAEGEVCADKAQILGVASGGAGSPSTPAAMGTPSAVRGAEGGLLSAQLNGRASEVLPASQGAVRFEKPSLFSAELPLGTAKEARMVRRAVTLAAARLADVQQGGLGASDSPAALGDRGLPLGNLVRPDFALRPASVLPVNVMLPYGELAAAAGVPGRANLLVSSRQPKELEQALAKALEPEDAGLVLEATNGLTVVKSRRVFLPGSVPAALAAAGLKPSLATFHLADSFEAGTNTTPYGFVAAVTPDPCFACVPGNLKDDEVVVSAWLAEALGVQTNETLTLRWRRFEAGGRLVADSRAFRVRAVIPNAAAAGAKAAMPVFPGLAGVDSCAAWDVGMPMDAEKLKDAANEAYWKQWRETPKAFLTFAAGKACFGTFFGEAMSVHVAADEATVRRALKGLTPAQAGFAVRPVWAEGLQAAQGSTDFRMLFAGMAFVLMVAALLLSALSLSLALETRKSEVALFSALGWSRGKVVRVLAAEWSVPLVLGAAAGGGLGAVLARVLVWSLGRFWREAFAGADMAFHFSWPTAGVAAGVSAVLTLAVLLKTVSRFAQCRPVELWQGVGRADAEGAGRRTEGGDLVQSVMGGLLAVAAMAVMVFSPSGSAANGVFFGAGFMLMLSLLLFVKTVGTAWFARVSHAEARRRGEKSLEYKGVAGPVQAGLCRALSVPRRSAPVVILLAVGTFLTVGILSMKHDPAAGCERPSSGSGGFASIVTSVTPMERERGLSLARRVSGGKGVVPVRVREGDEAGCLNMSQPQTPRLLGLDARAMARARAFEPENSGGVWTLIEQPLEDGTIPALSADQTMLQYSLKAKAGVKDGSVLNYVGTDGAAWRVRIVGALPVRSGILQGALILDERQFVRMFPEEGYRLWLSDAAPKPLRAAEEVRGRRSEVGGQGDKSRMLSSVLRHPEPGVTVETVQARLRLLGSVESAYLDIFLVLGGLGVVLGVAGIALVILRGVEERRGELALLSAVGLPRQTVLRLLTAEYGVLVLAGLVVGIVPALVAIQPAARALQGALPWPSMTGILAALFGSAAACVALAARVASRRYGPEVLKEEA
jgi:ABC-type lipoprotein release transport system permease subunit